MNIIRRETKIDGFDNHDSPQISTRKSYNFRSLLETVNNDEDVTLYETLTQGRRDNYEMLMRARTYFDETKNTSTESISIKSIFEITIALVPD